MTDSKNDVAWRSLFDKYQIIEEIENNRKLVITANQINEFREARLMTKFDCKSQLPVLFLKNKLSILPISRGSYVISNIETFKTLDTNDVEIVKVSFPNYLESIDYKNITSEAAALNCAYVSEIIQDFVEDKQEPLKPTVNGRMSSLSFSFKIKSGNSYLSINVDNSQIEIDGGYEGLNTLSLIEAKNTISDDFNIRQIYYPYRLWSNKINKSVKNLFLTYTNGIFHLREYIFEDINNYSSIKLIKQKKYAIREDFVINIESIEKILHEIEIIVEPAISFPQANSFERLINLCEQLNDHPLNKDDITENYEFVERQTNYYADAGRYLGLIDKKEENGQIFYFLTEKGYSLFGLSITERQLEFVKSILSHLVFKKTLEQYFKKSNMLSIDEIVEIMKTSNLYRIESDETFRRRASTISGWIKWIIGLFEE